MTDTSDELCKLQRMSQKIKKIGYHWIFIDFIFSLLIFLAIHLLTISGFVTVIDIEDFFTSMKDILLELFGFAGLIMVFAYGHLLNTKSEYTKFKIEQEFKSAIAIYQVGDDPVQLLFSEYEKMIERIDNQLKNINNNIDIATRHGFLALSFPFLGLLINIIEKIIIVNLNEFSTILLFFYMFILMGCFLNFLMVIQTVIKTRSEY